MNENTKKEILKSLELTKENLKNVMEVTLESYTETLSKIDVLTHMLINDESK